MKKVEQAVSRMQKGTIKGFTNTTYNEGENLSYLDIDGEDNAKSIFEFFANNSTNEEGKQPLEWGNVQTDESGGSKGNYVGTSFKEGAIGMLGYMKTLGKNIIKGSHNHPNGSDPSTKDMDNAANYPAGTILNVYVSTKGGVYTQYNNNGVFVDFGDGTKILDERNKKE